MIALIVLNRPLEHTENVVNKYIASKEKYVVLRRKASKPVRVQFTKTCDGSLTKQLLKG